MERAPVLQLLRRDERLRRHRARRPPAGIHLDPHEALAKWRIRCKDVALVFPNASASGLPKTGERHGAAAQIDLELTFETWMPPSGSVERQTSVDELKYVNVTSAGHFEQAGRYHGKIR
ncbi:MAG: hypothetical protein E6G04_12855, partial [Actinobacteria bacterium]